ncbi:hypothetical protein ABZP36_030031 [Zizania latifolia]
MYIIWFGYTDNSTNLSTRYYFKTLIYSLSSPGPTMEGGQLGAKEIKKRRKNASGKNSIHVHSKHPFEKLPSEHSWDFSCWASGLHQVRPEKIQKAHTSAMVPSCKIQVAVP